MFSCVIADIVSQFSGADTLIMGDVTYGACCVDDYTALALGADFLVHYGHSCLVSIDTTRIRTLYIFVDITFDLSHLIESLAITFEVGKRICLFSTIQFASSLPVRTPCMVVSDYFILDRSLAML